MKKVDWKTCLRIGISIFVLYLAIHYWPGISDFLGELFSASAPVFLGFVIAYIVNILMSFYERHFFPKTQKRGIEKTRRGVCLAGALVTVVGIVVLIGVLIIPQLINCIKLVAAELPGAIEKLIAKLNSFTFISDELLDSLASIDWKSRIADLVKPMTSGLGDVMNVALAAVSTAVSAVINGVIGFIISLYLLSDKERLFRQWNSIVKNYIPKRFSDKILHVLSIANSCFHRFIVGQCTEAVILGTLCMLGMMILQLPYAPMIGALFAFTALIPIVGGLIGATVGAFLILTESPIKALIFIVFVIVLQQVEGNLIYPKVVGSSIGLPAIWVLAAVTVGGSVMGIAGMLLGVPLAATAYRLIREDLEKRSIRQAAAQHEAEKAAEAETGNKE